LGKLRLGSVITLMVAGPLVAGSKLTPRNLAFERAGAVWIAAADGIGAVKVLATNARTPSVSATPAP
jgi:hypothetical protein